MKRNLKSLLTLTLLALVVLTCTAIVSGDDVENILPLVADWTEKGEFQGADYGISVASAGDVNGDGFKDVIIGAQNYPVVNGDGTKYGAAFVHLGGSGGIATLPQVTLSSVEKGSWFGGSVSSAGDVNGDGYDDVIVGAPHSKLTKEYNGAAYLYLGSASGVDALADWSYVFPAGETEFGSAVAGAGDVNGDGYDDVLIGAPRFESDADLLPNEGAVFLFLGNASGLAADYSWSYTVGQAAALLGSSVAGIGDINGDGYDDIAFGAPNLNYFLEFDFGGVWVFYGSASGPGLVFDWRAIGPRQYSLFGSSVDGAGDVNGDGYLDLIVGACGFDTEFNVDVGAAYIFYGNGSGLQTTPGWMVSSDQPYSGFGISVAGLGDVNQDGYADVGVGAPKYSAGESKEGSAFVYRGSNIGVEQIFYWTAGGDKADADFGASLCGAGDVNGDGNADVLVGSPLYKEDNRIVMGKAMAYYGTQAADATRFLVFIPAIIR